MQHNERNDIICGIGGFSLAPGSTINVHKLASSLLGASEIRGHDAAGFAWVSPTDDGVYKKDQPGSKLHVGRIPNDATAVLTHTRNWTKGSPTVMENNHPIISPSGNIRLVHNGVIYNHQEIRFVLGESGKKLPEVDSAVIPAVIEEMGLENTDILAGDAAVAWFDRETGDTIHLAKFSHNPVTFAQLVDGSFVFASTADILAKALNRCDLDWIGFYPAPFDSLAEGEYLQIQDGEVIAESTVGWDTSPRSIYSGWRQVTEGKKSASEFLAEEAAKKSNPTPPGTGTTLDLNKPFVAGTVNKTVGSEDATPMALSQAEVVRAFFMGDDDGMTADQYNQWMETGEFELAEVDDIGEGSDDEEDSGLDPWRPVFYTFSHDGDYSTYPNLSTLVSSMRWHAQMTGGENYLAGPDDGDMRWINYFSDIGHLNDDLNDENSWVKSSDYMQPFENLLPPFIKDGVSKLGSMVGA